MLHWAENSTTWLSSFELYPDPVGCVREFVLRYDLRISDAGLPALSDKGKFDWDHGVPDLYLGLSLGFAMRARAPCPSASQSRIVDSHDGRAADRYPAPTSRGPDPSPTRICWAERQRCGVSPVKRLKTVVKWAWV
jgi:hypothetical protein